MLSLIDAFRASRIPKQNQAGKESATIRSKDLRPTAGRCALILGLACLPLGAGCRSGSPSDWVGERVAMTHAWHDQSSQVRGEDASFQEGWRSGFHDGRSQASLPSPEREPAQFEAFMNSKRDEAMSNWRRGYDSGFIAAGNSDTRHHAHAELFPGSADQLDASISQPMTPTLPTLPTRPTALSTLPTISPAEERAYVSPSTSEINSPAASSFDNAAAVLDSVIKRNAARVTKSEESATIDPAPGLTQPTAPEAPESKSKSDGTPDKPRSIMELPLDDNDVAETPAIKNARSNISVLESATISTSPAMTVEAVSATVAASHLTFGQIPHAYQGRMQLGHIVTNPHVASTEPAPQSPKILDHPPTSAGQPLSQNTIAPNQVATFVETNSGAFNSAVPIAYAAPNSPSIQVTHEATPVAPNPSAAPQYLPKGLPLQKRK
ncbi:MAG: hypothetical protein Q8M16_06640 [Pirellulaceae bacterium]|nr:hypothetical protein [Pirellulaceae bacterium]